MGIPLGFESFELPNKDFLAVEDLGNNKELALISVPEEVILFYNYFNSSDIFFCRS